MKCPKCNYNQPAKRGMKCRCGYQFSFNPKSLSTPKMTDGKFLSAVSKASQNGTQYFTGNQLYSAYVAKYPPSRLSPYFGAIGFILLGGLISATGFGAVFGVPLALFGLFRIVWLLLWAGPTYSRSHFEMLIRKWRKDGKELPQLVDQPTLHNPPPDWEENDIYDYGAEKLLIVERDIMVDLFVLNNQHAEQRMLVVSENGYPSYLCPRANQLLLERPDLPVYLLHDATPEGMGMRSRLRSSTWLELGNREIVDLGFTPDDFASLKRTRNFDYHKKERELPMDALLMLGLADTLGYCLMHDISTHQLFLERRKQENTGSYG